MTYTLDEIKKDIVELESQDFFVKYILRSSNWYFENILNATQEESVHINDDFKQIISKNLGISFNNIAMVGSGKLGYSLSPKSSGSDKLFKCFNDDPEVRAESDVDVAIISNVLFEKYWELFRRAYSDVNKHLYRYISRGIYRGYINEKYLQEIDLCRESWNEKAKLSKKYLTENLYIKHKVSFRIYRSWEDFEEYHLQAIEEIKREV